VLSNNSIAILKTCTSKQRTVTLLNLLLSINMDKQEVHAICALQEYYYGFFLIIDAKGILICRPYFLLCESRISIALSICFMHVIHGRLIHLLCLNLCGMDEFDCRHLCVGMADLF
jgi:hypothetical protein